MSFIYFILLITQKFKNYIQNNIMYRSSSKEQLEIMHNLLDKQLNDSHQNSSQEDYQPKQSYKPQSNKFSALRYKPKDHQNNQVNDQKQQSKSNSLFRRSMQRKQQLQKSLNKSRQKDPLTYQNNNKVTDSNSLKGSRKSEINQLQRKLMDLQRKMDNISVDSDDESIQDLKKNTITNYGLNNNLKQKTLTSKNKQNQKKIKLKENDVEQQTRMIIAQKNQGTARFSVQYQEVQAHKEKKMKRQQESQEEDSEDIQIDIKYQKYTKNKLKNIHNLTQKLQNKKMENEEEQQDDYEVPIERKPIFKNQMINAKHISSSAQKKLNEIVKPNIHQIPSQERKHSVEAQSLLKPKYKASRQKTEPEKLNIYNFNKSREKRSSEQRKQPNSFRSIQEDKKSSKSKSKLSSKNQVQRESSKKSLKSNMSKKKSIKNISDNVSVKSNQRSFNYQQQDGNNVQAAKQVKKIQNLQKQVEHYKRLTRKLQQKVDQMRIMEIQYKKLKSNFGKSQQIRLQQKKIIQQLKNKQR